MNLEIMIQLPSIVDRFFVKWDFYQKPSFKCDVNSNFVYFSIHDDLFPRGLSAAVVNGIKALILLEIITIIIFQYF